MKIKELLVLPPVIFAIYIFISCIVIMGYSLFFATDIPPLPIYAQTWPWVQGGLRVVTFFPALIMSGLLIPFGFPVNSWKGFDRFSPLFWKKIKSLVITAISANVVYGLIFFLILPLIQDYKSYLNYQGYLFNAAKEKAHDGVEKGVWGEVIDLLVLCDQIWPNNPEILSLREAVDIGLEELRYAEAEAIQESLRDYAESYGSIYTYPEYIGDREPINVIDALTMADRAMQENRYYDAYWLANLVVRLARSGSLEAIQGMNIINRVKNAIAVFEPSAKDTHLYSLYHKKRDGYDALIAENWIEAYYIFKELATELPGDIDVTHFLALSEQGCEKVAFFIDEIELAVGEVRQETIFSFPANLASENKTGRIVLRVGSLSTAKECSYGLDIALMAFDDEGKLLYQTTVPYGKMLPVDSGTLLMMQALDRDNSRKHYEPVWIGQDQSIAGNSQIILDIPYGSFQRLSKLGQGLDMFFIGDIFDIVAEIDAYGYIPQVFQAEIVYRFFDPGTFFPLTILMIILGWRYRVRKLPFFLGIPMLIILPLVFNGVMLLYRSILNTFSMWSVLTLGFSLTIVFFSVGLVVFSIFTLILLTAQYG